MKRVLKSIALAGVAGVLAVTLLYRPADGRNMDIKQLMGDNFGNLQKILVDLIRSDYRTVPHDVDIIAQHAAQLVRVTPKILGGTEEQFLAMAYSLQTHANHLKLIVDTLNDRDSVTAAGGLLNVDYMRNSAAAHFGQMVTACVACHNQFRRRMVR